MSSPTEYESATKKAQVLLALPFLALLIQFICTTGNFSPGFFGDALASVQRSIAAGLICLSAISAFVLRPTLKVDIVFILLLSAIFFAMAISGILSDNVVGASMKSGMLLLSTACAVVLSYRIPFSIILRAFQVALFVLTLAAPVAHVLNPSLSTSHIWHQDGDWVGIFTQKNVLGFCSGYLFFISLSFFVSGDRAPISLIGIPLGAAVSFLAGSRGAIGYSLIAIVWVAGAKYKSISRLALLGVAIGAVIVTIALMAGLSASLEGDYFILGNHQIVVNRIPLWSYALNLWSQHPILGYGLGGAWSEQRIAEFMAQHDWVLDNFHSGYVSNFVELGLIGFVPLAALLLLTARRTMWLYRTTYVADREQLLCAAFFWLFMLSNFTETYLFRSTDARQFIFTCALAGLWRQNLIASNAAFRSQRDWHRFAPQARGYGAACE